ncbi:hypothetical protein [Roseomonas indoligenes]|uniref:Uncharacterized protein n=1 Tax=Roseomonas indoligenes TaxID=2820811 RepID=A0A940MV10_9PROT|nr:hypothetical protein [Pararoseomonas indoligenes]MBP0491747.1 hypothetical protein [Pararoseomonas indoligenes]
MRFGAGMIAMLAGLALAAPAGAQNSVANAAQEAATRPGQPPSAQSTAGSECNAGGKAEEATGPAPSARDGTAPGSAGSTGWSGGTGGSYIGNNPAGASGDSATWQPPTSRGLDPIGAPMRARASC